MAGLVTIVTWMSEWGEKVKGERGEGGDGGGFGTQKFTVKGPNSVPLRACESHLIWHSTSSLYPENKLACPKIKVKEVKEGEGGNESGKEENEGYMHHQLLHWTVKMFITLSCYEGCSCCCCIAVPAVSNVPWWGHLLCVSSSETGCQHTHWELLSNLFLSSLPFLPCLLIVRRGSKLLLPCGACLGWVFIPHPSWCPVGCAHHSACSIRCWYYTDRGALLTVQPVTRTQSTWRIVLLACLTLLK